MITSMMKARGEDLSLSLSLTHTHTHSFFSLYLSRVDTIEQTVVQKEDEAVDDVI